MFHGIRCQHRAYTLHILWNSAKLWRLSEKWQQCIEIQDVGDRQLEYLETMHFRHHRYVPNQSPNVSTKFGEDRSIVKKWQQFIEIQDGGSRYLENYTSC